jgi:Uma2 family endonuclease
MATQPKTLLTPEQYLEIERVADHKSEYFGGQIFAMAGAPEAHNLVVGNAFGELRQQCRARPCRVYANDMRVRIRATDLYTYPDIATVCGEPQFLDERRDTLLNPALLIEALSPSTEADDRGRKFEHYKTIESLREYLLLATDRVHADLYTRQADGRWLLTSASRLEDVLTLDSVDARLLMSDIYDKVELSANAMAGPRFAEGEDPHRLR